MSEKIGAALPAPPLKSYQRIFVNASVEDLRALLSALRALQEPYGKTFWRLEQLIARIATELQRRQS